MNYNPNYLQFNPHQKGEKWADDCIRDFRLNWCPLVDPITYGKKRDLILSRNNMEEIIKMFKDPKQIGFEIIPICVIEKIRNVLFGERYRAGVGAEIQANDPASEKERSADRNMLKNRREFEGLMSFLQTSIGLPDYKITQEAGTAGQPFAGNLEKFDELGLDDGDDGDISYFFRTHYKMLVEMDLQEIVNAYFDINETGDYIEEWVNDIMAVKALGGRVFVNQVTGGMDYQYFAPDRIKTIPGPRNDSKKAICVGFEDSRTVAEVIAMIGHRFDFNKHMTFLVNAVNFFGGRNVVEVTDQGVPVWGRYHGSVGTERVNFDEFSNYKVGIGYIEWKSIDAEGYKIGRDFAGNSKTYPLGDYAIQLEADSPYQKEVRHKWTTYKSYFLATSTQDQLLIDFGKLYHQCIEGAEDEYSNYSLFYKLLAGPSVADVAQPWIKLAQETFYKFKWMVRKAKPKGRSYNYESLVKMAKHMIAEGNLKAKVTQLIKMWEEGINEMYTLPEVNGEKVGGGSQVHHDLPNGLDPTAIHFKGILEWCYQMISGDIGMNDVRSAESMAPNSGYRLQMSSMEASRNATEYIDFLIDAHAREKAKRYILTAQDIIRYKDTVPYNYLKHMVGGAVLDRLEYFLGKRDKMQTPYRMGMFVRSLLAFQEQQRIIQHAEVAHQKGEIPFEVLMLITRTKDPDKASYILSYEKKRAERKKLEEQQKMHENAMQLEQQTTKNKLMIIQAEGQRDQANIKAKGYFEVLVQEKENQGELQKAQLKIDHEPSKEEKRTDEATRKYANQKTIDAQHDAIV